MGVLGDGIVRRLSRGAAVRAVFARAQPAHPQLRFGTPRRAARCAVGTSPESAPRAAYGDTRWRTCTRPAWRTPGSRSAPENSLHRLGALFGYQDINLPEHPGFSRACLLRGPDETAIRGAFTPAVVEFFERNAHMCAAADGPDLLFWYPWRVEGEPMLTLIDNALTLAALLENAAADGSAELPSAEGGVS